MFYEIRIIVRIFKKTKNKLSNFDIKKESGLSQKEFKDEIKLLGLNFYNIKSLVNIKKGNLIADFVLIPSYGNSFVFPYGPIYNYNTKTYTNCLVLLFIVFESEDKIYPILFDYWISEIYYEDKDKYLSKTDIFIKAIKYIINQGLNAENILLNAGFLNKEVLEEISKIGLNIVIRCPESRILNLEENQIKAKDIFKYCYNGEFYYYHKLKKFLNDRSAYLYNVKGKIVSVCNNKECLLNKNFFFTFSLFFLQIWNIQ